jgi:hypothetical protein
MNQLAALPVPIEKPKDLAYSIQYFGDPVENVPQFRSFQELPLLQDKRTLFATTSLSGDHHCKLQ